VIALGGNAILRRGEEPTAAAQRRNVERAVRAVARVAREHQVVITHGNGPQVGVLALQRGKDGGAAFPLDVLGAQTEGMIGYLLSQGLQNELPERQVATILTQVEVDPDDPAFDRPTKPIGAVMPEDEARRLAEARGWELAPERLGWRRVVPSPEPRRILEVDTVRLLVDHGVLVVCAGGGGIPVIFDSWGRVFGVEAVIDKDRTAALLARDIDAEALLLLTDVDGVYRDWGTKGERLLERLDLDRWENLGLPEGSMRPKVVACADFVRQTGGFAAIGALEDAERILAGSAGTRVYSAA
jgi:carbamate kinase